jgi:tetratricopeptide (TPR) repeat protein
MDKYEDAIDAFNIVLSNNSSDTQIWFKMGASLFHLGKFAGSIESFNRVIGFDSRYSTTAKEYAKIAAAENASGEDHHCEQDSD